MAEEALLAQHALRLAQGFARMLKDMRGLDYRLDEANARVHRAGLPGGAFPMRVGIRFHGFLSGEYIVHLGLETAAGLAGLWKAGQGLAALEAARDEGESLVKEVLNSTVGVCIRELERVAGALDFDPATAEYGSEGRAGILSGGPWADLLVLGEAGPVLCSFFLEPRGPAGG